MKGVKLLAFLIALSSSGFGQQEINSAEVARHEGDSVIVCSKVFAAGYFEGAKGAPTLLNAGAYYPEAPLTAVIFGGNSAAF